MALRRFTHLLLLLIFGIAAALPLAGQAAPSASETYRAGEVLVQLRPGYSFGPGAAVQASAGYSFAPLAALNQRLRTLGTEEAERLALGNGIYRLRLSSSASPAAIARMLAANPAVAYAQPNYTYHLMRTPNDPALREQWALRNIQAYEAWDITTGGGVVVAVLDTGVDRNHPDLQGKVLNGYNSIENSGNSSDGDGHGTAVSGLIAASSDNGTGIAGLCWGCQILPIKVLDDRGRGDDVSVAQGIRWATDNGARVINMSLGGDEDSQVLRDAVNYALGRNVVVIASSGNGRQEGNTPNYPAAYPGVLAVGATNNSDQITGFSTTGDYVGISAPGVGLWTTLPGDQYGPPNGTSFSSPYVAGAAALVLTLRGDLPVRDVVCVLEASADDKGAPGKDPEYGWGRLNVVKALQLASGYTGCPLGQPAPQPGPGNAPAAFAPIPPFASTAERVYFPETQHSLGGEFKRYWERNGGLPIFGFPLSEEFVERGEDGRDYVVQYFERFRFEFHADKAPPYNVQLGRLGDAILRLNNRDWFSFSRSGPRPGCAFFEETGQAVCDRFLSYWSSNGLEIDGRRGKTFQESLALFGMPISQPEVREVEPGVFVVVQWFERARLEDHGDKGILLGLLSSELTRARGWR
ncbi:MAG: S8 family peptidase [Chloroflexaceae bacterium]|nr:S8 family peptidase [Chloroflexaceae bacterium]